MFAPPFSIPTARDDRLVFGDDRTSILQWEKAFWGGSPFGRAPAQQVRGAFVLR